jgi:homocitrate synthase
VIDPRDFGVGRTIQIAHRLTGWNAVQERCKQLKLNLTPDQVLHPPNPNRQHHQL